MKEGYYHNQESVKEYIRLAAGVSGSQLISKLKKILPAKSELLEIGSGPGTDWKILMESFSVVGSDNSEQFLNHLIENNPQGKFLLLDAVSLDVKLQFDGIYSNKVLQHLTDDELQESIKRQRDVLKNKGIVCHSFWKGEGSEVFKGLFVNYQTENTIRQYFKSHFEILSIESYQEFEADDSLLIIARRK